MNAYQFLNDDPSGEYDADAIFAEPEDMAVNFKEEEDALIDEAKSEALRDILEGTDNDKAAY
jgi:hypothetical protein